MGKRKNREATILFAGDRLAIMEQFYELAKAAKKDISITCAYTLAEGTRIPLAYRDSLTQEHGLALSAEGTVEGRQQVIVNYAPDKADLLSFLSANNTAKQKKESYEMDTALGICSVSMDSHDLHHALSKGDKAVVYQLKHSLFISDVRVNEVVGSKLLYDPKHQQSASRFLERIEKGEFPEPLGEDTDLKTLSVALDGCRTKVMVLGAVALTALVLYAGYVLTKKGSAAIKSNNDRLEKYMGEDEKPPAPAEPTPPSARATPKESHTQDALQRKEQTHTPPDSPEPAKGATKIF